MIYKAVMNKNRYTISHAGPMVVDKDGRWHIPAGSPGGGRFMDKPDDIPTGSTASDGPRNYSRQNPYAMSNDEIKEANTRANLISKYEQYYGSTQGDIDSLVKNTNMLVDKGASFAKKVVPEQQRRKLDLTGMSNQELSDYIYRANLERQYNDYYNPPKVDKTKEYIDIAATGLALAISAAGVAAQIIVPIALAKKKNGGK